MKLGKAQKHHKRSTCINHFRNKSSRKNAKILVVEDNPDHWTIIKNAMQQRLPEFEPVHAVNATEALEFLDDYSARDVAMPQLILLDLYLPGREHGWRLLEQLKNRPAPFNQLPVVVISYSNCPKDITESYQRGGNSYLVKPTAYEDWLLYFQTLKDYWLETVTLPDTRQYF